MSLSPVQDAGLKLWTSIQRGKEKSIASILSDDFKATMVVDGKTMILGKKEFVDMCLKVGKTANVLFSLQFEYGAGKWKNEENVYLIRYQQNVAYLSTEALNGASNEETLSEPKMFSNGLQVLKWTHMPNEWNKITLKFTRLYQFEVNKTVGPIKDLMRDKLSEVLMGSQLKKKNKEPAPTEAPQIPQEVSSGWGCTIS